MSKDEIPVDADADGDLDLALLVSSTDEVSILWNHEIEATADMVGDLSFKRKLIPGPGEVAAGALADLNGDGALDFVQMAPTGLLMYRFNDGAGDFRETTVEASVRAGRGRQIVLARIWMGTATSMSQSLRLESSSRTVEPERSGRVMLRAREPSGP